ncbi:hypothetical protein GOODEAATRI_017919, partial [Goodea atripinnis]
ADFFETFWDSGEARVGEVGARGWKAWMTQQERGGWVQPPAACPSSPSSSRSVTQLDIGKSSKRVAKRLLKEPENRSSLVLWREYAHLEWMLSNLDEARKVFSTATAMGGTKGLSSPALCELCLLWSQLEVENTAKELGGVTDVENRYHSAGRARRFFHTVTRDNSSLVPRLFAIVAEQHRRQLVDAAQR